MMSETNGPTEESASGRSVEFSSESELLSEFYKYMKDPTNVETATNYLFHSLLDEIILGVVFEMHRSIKTGAVDTGEAEDISPYRLVDVPNYDVFGLSTAKKLVDCTFNCPNCESLVNSSKFAPHLAKCMGLANKETVRKSSRVANRQLANAREGNRNYFSSTISDDENDVDWSLESSKKKSHSGRNNGSKKNGKFS